MKETCYIYLIMDEAPDITIKDKLCLCLHYVEEGAGEIYEAICLMKPNNDTSGQGKKLYRIISAVGHPASFL